jgi:hypothetical protein
MRTARALRIALTLLAVASASAAVAHTGGSNGYASIAIDGATARYTLMLWPATLPPEVAETLRLARASPGPGRDRLLGWIRDKVTLSLRGGAARPGPDRCPMPRPPSRASARW